MFIRLQMLQRSIGIQEQLAKDGWELQRQSGGSWLAHHLSVQNEPTARLRLANLGLLTSSRLRIQFLHHLQVVK